MIAFKKDGEMDAGAIQTQQEALVYACLAIGLNRVSGVTGNRVVSPTFVICTARRTPPLSGCLVFYVSHGGHENEILINNELSYSDVRSLVTERFDGVAFDEPAATPNDLGVTRHQMAAVLDTIGSLRKRLDEVEALSKDAYQWVELTMKKQDGMADRMLTHESHLDTLGHDLGELMAWKEAFTAAISGKQSDGH